MRPSRRTSTFVGCASEWPSVGPEPAPLPETATTRENRKRLCWGGPRERAQSRRGGAYRRIIRREICQWRPAFRRIAALRGRGRPFLRLEHVLRRGGKRRCRER